MKQKLSTLAMPCLLAALLLVPSSASASRTFDSAIVGPEGGFDTVFGVALDGNDDLWVVDDQAGSGTSFGDRGIYKYSAYPSQTLLETPDMSVIGGSRALRIAIDKSTNAVYVSQSNSRFVEIYENGVPTHEWANFNGVVEYEGIDVAIDNSPTDSRGRIYISLTNPENDVEVFDSEQRPVQFPAAADYIEGNSLTGTPSGPFGKVGEIATDDAGNLYVSDQGAEAVDEFDSSGTFVRAFDGSGGPGSRFTPFGVAVDPTNGNVLINAETEQFRRTLEEFDSSGNFLGIVEPGIGGHETGRGDAAFNSAGYLYVPNYNKFSDVGPVEIFKPAGPMPTIVYGAVSGPTTTSGTLHATVDPNQGGNILTCQFEYGTDLSYSAGTKSCLPASEPYTGVTEVSAALTGLTTETPYHYRVVVTTASGTKYGSDRVYAAHRVVGLATEPAGDVGESSATLNGSLVGDGTDTHYYFEWGRTTGYGNTIPVLPGGDLPFPSGPTATPLSAQLTGLSPYTTYHYRVVASNGSGTSVGEDRMFTTTIGIPSITNLSVAQVHSDRVILKAQVNPDGAETAYHFEYVTAEAFAQAGWANASIVPGADVEIGRGRVAVSASVLAGNLEPGTTYRFRVVATNRVGVGTPATDHSFETFAVPSALADRCPNSHERQQTGASQLTDCRAYELVSAASTGGYDVESNLVPGQTPFGGFPEATDGAGNPKVLYGIHSGALNTGEPTNRGVDPYVATRGEHGWSTSYEGIPASNPFASEPFSSTLLEADANLDTLAFGGPEICSPCFADGSMGTPLRLPGGELVQGMTGTNPHPDAEPVGFLARRLSADGSHFLFGSTSAFEADADEGQISIFDRDLAAEPPVTHMISKTPLGANLPCLLHCTSDGIGALDISTNGSRVLLGQLASEAEGRRYWHLYMNVGDSPHTIDVTPGALGGVLYDGMTADGHTVYFTSEEPLTSEDHDNSADIYRAEVTDSSSSLTLVSAPAGSGAGEPGNSDDCEPASNTKYLHWNTTGPSQNCGVLAIGGGGGVAAAEGTIFFLSPENLDSSNPQNVPVENAPNLYLDRPGSTPVFVSTVESSLTGPTPFPSGHLFRRNFGSFSSGRFIAVDNSGGPSAADTYVAINRGESSLVLKFDQAGNLMTGWGVNGRLAGAPGEPWGIIGGYAYGISRLIDGIAVDDQGTLYVSIDGNGVSEFKQDGTFLRKVEANSRFVNDNSGFAVDNAGDLYTYEGGVGLSHITKWDSFGTRLGYVNRDFPITGFGVDPVSGDVYINKVSGGAYRFAFNGAGEVVEPGGTTCPLSTNGCRPTASFGHEVKKVNSISVDPTSARVYLDNGHEIAEFEPSGEQVGGTFGAANITNSNAIAAQTDHGLKVLNLGGAVVSEFGPTEPLSDPAADSQLVIDSVRTPEVRRTTDFQVTPDGRDAAFVSALPLTGYDSAFHTEVYRYDAPSADVDCASCNPTSEQATGNASLPSDGLGISNDGRVFFNSEEGLVDRDLNGLEDAYEWRPLGSQSLPEVVACHDADGCIELISRGASPNASSMLSVSADGADAYFFTRDKLVEFDENGNTVKVYDARTQGGFAFSPSPAQCKASDECHGPGSPQPPPPRVTSTASAPEREAGKSCRKGFVLRKGKCASKHRKHRSHAKQKRRGHHQ
jgi:hypothetical protein